MLQNKWCKESIERFENPSTTTRKSMGLHMQPNQKRNFEDLSYKEVESVTA